MSSNIRLWKVTSNNSLQEINQSSLDLEARIEDWLEADISIISDNLLVIGRQIPTDFGGLIDLLCIDHDGDLVIVELKRDKTPRDVTAQVLDYASWVKDLANDTIAGMASEYLPDGESLETAFHRRFQSDLPEILNERHKMLIVASRIDGNSERIITYLSDTYGISINAVTFQYFQDESGNELLARVFLIEPDQVEYRAQTKGSSKRKPNLTYEQLQEIAEQNGVGGIYALLVDRMRDYFDRRSTTTSSVAFAGSIEDSQQTVFNLMPSESSLEAGLRFHAWLDRLARYFNTEKAFLTELLPLSERGENYAGEFGEGYFSDEKQASEFLNMLADLEPRRAV